ncbi:MAG: flagellar motor protein MotB [Candidatus Korobacteraceae bacterium]|jgi:chemotaxis protein MotB
MKNRRRRSTAEVNHERWLVSYADFVTLLFAFFVVLYASAQIDKQRASRLSDAINSAFQQLGIFERDGHKPGEIDPRISLPSAVNGAQDLSRWAPAGQEKLGADQKKQDFNAIRSELEKALAAEIARNEVALHMEADGLVVSLREAGFFDSGSATIKPGAEAAFARVANILREHYCAVRIEGHTDNVPIHTSQFASNWELSTTRSTSLVKALVEQYGVPAERLSAAGYAEFHPAASNDTAKGRQLNRRVDVVILTSPQPRQLTSPAWPADKKPATSSTSDADSHRSTNRAAPSVSSGNPGHSG